MRIANGVIIRTDLASFAASVGESFACAGQLSKASSESAKAARCYGLEVDAVTIRRKGGSAGQATMAMFQMKNLAGGEYADRQAIEHSGPDGGAIKTEATVFNFTFVPRTKRVTIEGEIVDRVPSALALSDFTGDADE